MDKIVEKVENYVDHYRKLEEDLNELESEWQVLKRRKTDVNSRIQVEVHSGQVVKEEVKGWLEDVRKMEQDIQDVKERAITVPYYKRASLDEDVHKKIEEVKRIQERGNFKGGLGIERAPACGIEIPTENLEGEISTKDEIWEHLMGNKVGMIGVCGIGGVGKTTIMKHVNNDLLTGSRFQKVIWVTVSYPLNVFELQKKIAGKMKETLPEDEEVMMRAAALMEIMRRVRFVLILDDVWERFTLSDVGIPEPTVQNGCKVIITSRSTDVCSYLDCKIVKVQPLSQEESLTLFLNQVGHDVLQISGLEKILQIIVKECAGLPLAIVVIAGSMKGVDDIKVWRNALTELQECVKSVKGSEDEIFMRLKFSFDRLPDEKIKNCFLYCSLFREDYSFQREELIEGWIDEGLMDGLRSREAAYDKGHAFLDVLEKNSLLEKHFETSIKMHDVVRDMAIRSIGPGVGYMVKTGMKLTNVPNEHEWARDLNKVSLTANDISKISIGLPPKCPTLSTLILSNNPLKEIPESFFEDMSQLKVLDLSRTRVKTLPSSISKLKYLSALRLKGCEKLKCLPSLEKLVALKKLDLEWVGIEVVPQGMEMLVGLEYLNLWSTKLKEFPTGILSKLSSLQYLVVTNIRGTNQGGPIVMINSEEVAKLRKLEIMQCNVEDMQDFNYLMREFKNFQSFIVYELRVGTKMDLGMDYYNPKHKCVLIISECDIREECIVLPDKLRHLRIHKCKNLRSSFNKTALLENATELGGCIISDCEETEYVVELDSSFSSSCKPVLDKLEKLCLWDLPRLWALVRVEGVATPPRVFSNLKTLYIRKCSGMRKLLPLELLQAFQNLEMIEVDGCEQMEEIIASSDSDASSDKFSFTFPKLSHLKLQWLPQLKSICNAKGVMVCDSIKSILIRKCPELKRIPVQLHLLDNGQPSPPHLKEIYINEEDKEWWESVEWDHPNAKNILQPFLQILW
ncbi:hypothetical protein SLEP1_g4976 [Rubroshorea leprosula]|uniref:NB-ARC domain-containing protein n=1 Tax=Rubroshorea leprosula TaxID=152421 RepID=A0AAV5HYA8_9ROSI|nr:hypothetical protein SLEP1_g4976 [Rubroshorea leprosula]